LLCDSHSCRCLHQKSEGPVTRRPRELSSKTAAVSKTAVAFVGTGHLKFLSNCQPEPVRNKYQRVRRFPVGSGAHPAANYSLATRGSVDLYVVIGYVTFFTLVKTADA
jgi:hypothetical protein